MASIDLSILHTLYGIRSSGLVHFFTALSTVGDTIAMLGITVLVALLLYVWAKEKALALGLLSSMVTSTVLTYGLKTIIARARPDLMYQAYAETGYSFPSGHSSAAAAFCGFFAYVVWKRMNGSRRALIITGLVCYALLMGFGRLYLGVHYFSDVIGGFVVGALAAWIGTGVMKWMGGNRSELNREALTGVPFSR